MAEDEGRVPTAEDVLGWLDFFRDDIELSIEQDEERSPEDAIAGLWSTVARLITAMTEIEQKLRRAMGREG